MSSTLNKAAALGFLANLYTPKKLLLDRSDLNITWLRGGDEGDDEARSFDVVVRPDGGLESNNAWPSEGCLCFEKGRRLMVHTILGEQKRICFKLWIVGGYRSSILHSPQTQPYQIDTPFCN